MRSFVRSVGRLLGAAAILALGTSASLAQDSPPKGGTVGPKGESLPSKAAKADPLARFPKVWFPGASAPPTSTDPRSLRMGAGQVIELGGGSEEKGLDDLGERGLQLVCVTYGQNNATYHMYFRCEGLPLEYRVLSEAQIDQLGGGDFNAGLKVLDDGYYKLRAVTHSPTGAAGWHYFSRLSHEEGDSVPPKEGKKYPSKPKDVEKKAVADEPADAKPADKP